jgi:tRNA1(Val) A37 N6-methylase TrmN6
MPSAQQLRIFDERTFPAEAVECTIVQPPIETRRQDPHKALGAYYTDTQIAEFLVWWALRSKSETLLDPAFGGGVFLRAGCKRLREIGGDTATQVFGVELDASVHQRIAEKLQEDGVARSNLLAADFFSTSAERIGAVDAVVGNPPFIRYQSFSGDMRRRALARAAEQGVKLSGLCSSWAPFLIHSVRFLRPGGRIAMVIPFEISHASYAAPILEHLDRAFESVTFLTFQKKLFPDLSQDTILLLAEGYREPQRGAFWHRDLPHAGTLASIAASGNRPLRGLRRLDRQGVASGQQRLLEYVLPRKARELYAELRRHSDVVTLGAIADVGIGYVTGANDFFHLNPREARERGIPKPYLRACVCRGRALQGLRFTETDWNAALDHGDAAYLLQLPGTGDLPATVERYIAEGERTGIHTTFKCRQRSPWYRVPHIYVPDAFLTYMSGDGPRLVSNSAGVVAPNTLHILRLRHEIRLSGEGLAALWRTSLTRLSAEIEGHAMGGGLLKLEPGEAEQVLAPLAAKPDTLEALASELDQVARQGQEEACTSIADRHLLRRLGLSAADIELLGKSADLLRERRTSRSIPNERRR